MGTGWYYTENIGGTTARWIGRELTSTLRVNLAPQDYRVALQATTIVPNQIVAVYANDRHLADIPIGGGWHTYTFDLPAAIVPANGLTTIDLVPAHSISPHDLTNGQSDDRRPLAAALASIQFVPH